jgi:hypothetical protein
MKSNELHTIHDVIVTDYTITKLPGGTARHQFRPSTTSTIYEFEANAVPVVKEGGRYNIGFTVTPDGRNVIDHSALSPSGLVNPMFSYIAAQQIASEKYDEEHEKNDRRVSHAATEDYYWGKKYAWRIFGACIAKEAFFSYLEEIHHPSVPCITQDSDYPASNTQSIAYAETGLEEAVKRLIASATKVTGAYYKSPLYSKKFAIKGINALTHKK